jgi:DNA-binding transcriptional LysR family regulator
VLGVEDVHRFGHAGTLAARPLADNRQLLADPQALLVAWRAVKPTLRQLEYFVAVAEHGGFTRAAGELHVAQQALSQQVRALEAGLGVTLLRRSSRRVELTFEGVVFLKDARAVLAASDRAVRRVQAAGRGEAGVLRVAYTLTTAYETTPALVALLAERHPELKVQTREVYGADVPDLLSRGRCDVALAPMTAHPRGVRHRAVRQETLRLAVPAGHELAAREHVELQSLREETFWIWPREMSPGYYDAIAGACRVAGFEPTLNEQGAGATVWGYLAAGRGIAMVVSSLVEQLPPGIALVDLAPPAPTLTIEAVWRADAELATIDRLLDSADALAAQRRWL